MGTDLTIIPVDYEDGKNAWGHSNLTVERDSSLWPLIAELKQVELDRPFGCHFARCEDGEHKYGDITEESYGEPLYYVRAEVLGTTIKDHESLMYNLHISAYLLALPSEKKIILYWH